MLKSKKLTINGTKSSEALHSVSGGDSDLGCDSDLGDDSFLVGVIQFYI